MSKLWLFLSLIIYPSSAFSEEDYLKLLEQADILRTSDPIQSRLLLDRIDEKLLNNKEKDLFLYLVGHNNFVNGKPLEAISNFQALTSGNSINIINIRGLSTLLITYSSVNYWTEALETASLLQMHIDEHQDLASDIYMTTQLSLLNFYNLAGEYEIAKQLAKKLQKINTSPRMSCIIRTELNFSFIKTSPNTLKTKDFLDTFELCKQLNDPLLVNIIKGYYAEYLLELGKTTEALEVLESCLPSVKTTRYQALLAGFYDLLAKSHLALKNYPEAENYAQILRETQEQHQYQPAMTTAYKVLSEVTEYRKNYEQAFYYYKKYSEAKRIALDQNNAKLLAVQKAKLSVVEKNTQIALLDKQYALLKTQAMLYSKSAQNRILVLGLLTMILIVFILWAYKNRKNYLKMRYFAQTDELTGIANRHYFAQLAFSTIELCKKTNQPVSFVIFDLDYFKKVNDSFGHQVGDEALKMAVNAVKSACRKNDIIGRLGGEEFGILLAGCGNHLAAHMAEKCRKAIEKVDTSASGHQFTITASFGVSDSSVCGYEFTKLFAGADLALYQSKDLGRNQVFNYQTNLFAFNI